MVTIQSISIKDQYRLIETLMGALQQSEEEMNKMSAPWASIKANYMCHLISCQEENDGTCLVAYNNQEIAGFMFAYLEEQDESRMEKYEGDQLYVSEGYIYPTFRRLGIYKQLNDVMEKHYVLKGIRRITRFTLSTNIRMHQFLETNGYQATRILYEKWLDASGEQVLNIELNTPK